MLFIVLDVQGRLGTKKPKIVEEWTLAVRRVG